MPFGKSITSNLDKMEPQVVSSTQNKPKINLKPLLFGVVAVVGFVGIFWYVNTYIYDFFAGTTRLTKTLVPVTNTVAVGDEFKVNLQASANNTKVTGLELFITYDASRIAYWKEVTGHETETGFEQLQANYFDDVIVEEVLPVDATKKKIHLLLTSKESSELGVASIALKFKAVAQGEAPYEAKIWLNKESVFVGSEKTTDGSGDIGTEFAVSDADIETKVTISASSGDTTPTATPTITPTPDPDTTATPTPTTTITPTPNPDATDTPTPTPTLTGTLPKDIKLKMNIRLQGIRSVPVRTNNISATVNLISNDKTVNKVANVAFTAGNFGIWTGEVSFGAVDIDRTYSVVIKGPLHLKKKFCQASPNESQGGMYRCTTGEIKIVEGDNNLNFQDVLILAGDLGDQDGIIDSRDVTYIMRNLGSLDAGVIQKADLNMDGIVDTQDYSMIIGALGFKYGDE